MYSQKKCKNITDFNVLVWFELSLKFRISAIFLPNKLVDNLLSRLNCILNYNPFLNSGTENFEDLQNDQIVELYRNIRWECCKCSILSLCKIWWLWLNSPSEMVCIRGKMIKIPTVNFKFTDIVKFLIKKHFETSFC